MSAVGSKLRPLRRCAGTALFSSAVSAGVRSAATFHGMSVGAPTANER